MNKIEQTAQKMIDISYHKKGENYRLEASIDKLEREFTVTHR